MGDARAAWAHWSNTRQWQITRSENRLVMIEGQPDRYPGTDEPIELWLDGHCGSFRSFEIVRDAATRPVKGPIFVNSLCICGAIRCSIANGSRSASDDFRNGNDQFTDTICAAMGVGQWQRLVGRPDLVTEHVRIVHTGQSAANGADLAGTASQHTPASGGCTQV